MSLLKKGCQGINSKLEVLNLNFKFNLKIGQFCAHRQVTVAVGATWQKEEKFMREQQPRPNVNSGIFLSVIFCILANYSKKTHADY